MAAGFSVVRWATREAPTVRRADGKADTVAHLVLACLAVYAGKDGRARPSLPTLADDARLADNTVHSALARLGEAGLVEAVGDLNGTTVWQLRTDRKRDETDKRHGQVRRDARLAGDAERAKKYRAARKARHAEPDRDVTPSQTVTNGSVTVNQTGRHGVPDRDVTVNQTGRHGVKTVITAGQDTRNCHRTTNELPIELPANGEAKRGRKRRTYPLDFEAFWEAYGHKGSKPIAATEWGKATARAAPEAIMAKVGPYVASTPDLQYRKDAERWLKGDCWESVIVPARNGHQPYRNPIDQSAYDEDLL